MKIKKPIIKSVISLILVIAITSAFAFSAFAKGFSDVVKGKWYYEPVTYCQDRGIVSGYKDGTFRPNKNITRAEFCVMLNKVADQLHLKKTSITDASACKQYEKTYTDYRSGKWYSIAVANCIANGYISGTSKTKLSLNSNILRQDVAVMVDKMFGWTFEYNTRQGGMCHNETYTDSQGNYHARYWVDAMYRFIDIGIYQGEKDISAAIRKYGSAYKNDQPITRAEMCTVFRYILENRNWINARENKYIKLDAIGSFYYIEKSDQDFFIKWFRSIPPTEELSEVYDKIAKTVTIDTVTIKVLDLSKTTTNYATATDIYYATPTDIYY